MRTPKIPSVAEVVRTYAEYEEHVQCGSVALTRACSAKGGHYLEEK